MMLSILSALACAPRTTAPPPPLPPARCADAAAVQTTAPWRVAETADLIAGLQPYTACSVVAGDFDRDGALDAAILEVDRDKRTSRLRLRLAGGQDIVAQSWPAVPEAVGGAAATFLIPKPAGAEVQRSYITDEQQQAVRSRDAVEVCSSADAASFDPGDLCYCSNFWMVDDGAAAAIMVCD